MGDGGIRVNAICIWSKRDNAYVFSSIVEASTWNEFLWNQQIARSIDVDKFKGCVNILPCAAIDSFILSKSLTLVIVESISNSNQMNVFSQWKTPSGLFGHQMSREKISLLRLKTFQKRSQFPLSLNRARSLWFINLFLLFVWGLKSVGKNFLKCGRVHMFLQRLRSLEGTDMLTDICYRLFCFWTLSKSIPS